MPMLAISGLAYAAVIAVCVLLGVVALLMRRQLLDRSGEVVRLRTERDQTQSALQTSRIRLRTLVAHLPVALWGLDAEGRFTLAEGQLLPVLGVDPASLKGSSVFERYGELPLALAPIRECLEGTPTSSVIEEGGRTFETHLSPLQSGDGGVAGVLGVTIDVSARREAEAERARLAEELSQSQKLQAVGQLASGIAHDFNDLLSGILGSAQLLERRCELDERGKRYVGNIVQAARRAAELPRSLLEYARKDRGLSIPVDVHGVVGWVVKVLRRTIDPKVEIGERLDATRTITLGDVTALHNALVNVALNARDAMPDGGTLTIRTRDAELGEEVCLTQPQLQPGRFVAISMSDTGTGIAEDVLPRVFDPFFSTKKNGTGLGLSTVFGCVRAHRGHVTIESTVGGTTVTIYLPLAPADAEPPGVARLTPPPGMICGTGRILLAEDEELARETMAEGLRLMGYQVDVCVDGISAIKRFQDGRYDLVILDVMMPGISGLQVLRQMSQTDPDVKALFVSGVSDDEGLDEGMPGIVLKPIELVSFSRHVAEAIASEA